VRMIRDEREGKDRWIHPQIRTEDRDLSTTPLSFTNLTSHENSINISTKYREKRRKKND
jgi:hypothetical protein